MANILFSRDGRWLSQNGVVLSCELTVPKTRLLKTGHSGSGFGMYKTYIRSGKHKVPPVTAHLLCVDEIVFSELCRL